MSAPAAGERSPAAAKRDGASVARFRGLHVFALDTACCALGALLADGMENDIVWTEGPRQADVLVITGSVNAKLAGEIRAVYEEMPHPKRVMAVGSCSLDGGPFRRYPNVVGGTEGVIPVDVRVPGCPPTSEAIRAAFAGLAEHVSRSGEGRGATRRG